MEERQLRRSGKDGSNCKPSLKVMSSLSFLKRTRDQETDYTGGYDLLCEMHNNIVYIK
ncbi:hypothetical protein BML2537_21290 [Providencia stuartii]|nr:hypothetical protein BML2537_21290 [Providencia stuartii]